MIKPLEILITEDNPDHLAGAVTASRDYKIDLKFSYACTLDQAKEAVENKKFDAVITDVFFPERDGEKPTWHSGLTLAKLVNGMGIPFVYNTSGNHHGREYQNFLHQSRALWDDYGFGTGKMIESYPKNQEAEKDTKQWSAAINYAVLLANSANMSEDVRSAIGDHLLKFSPFGDYGELTDIMRKTFSDVPLSTVTKFPLEYKKADVEFMGFARDSIKQILGYYLKKPNFNIGASIDEVEMATRKHKFPQIFARCFRT